MSDIELVIKIPEQIYVAIRKADVIISDQRNGKSLMGKALMSIILNAIANGTPLPKGHGRLKDVDKIKIVRAPDSMIDPNVEIALQAVQQYIDQLPTIIEADSGSNANTAGVEE